MERKFPPFTVAQVVSSYLQWASCTVDFTEMCRKVDGGITLAFECLQIHG